MLALAAWLGGRTAAPVGSNAVQAFCDQPGGRGFSNSSDAGQNECMGDSVRVERIAQYADHRILSDDLRECLRSIFPREYLVGFVHNDIHITGRAWLPPLDIVPRVFLAGMIRATLHRVAPHPASGRNFWVSGIKQMTKNLDLLRQQARRLSDNASGNGGIAKRGAQAEIPGNEQIGKMDALDAIAMENGFGSWTRLVANNWFSEMTPGELAERLKVGLYFGQHWVVEELLASYPETANADLGVQIALFDKQSVSEALAQDPRAALRPIGKRTPILHLAYSRHIHAAPELNADAIEIAKMLVENGADVNDGIATDSDGDHKLSALYGAVGHADNFSLAEWLLKNGAEPNDDESLYHSTEVGHRKSLKLLLENGARIQGTNALLRALDFNDHEAVALMLSHGADPSADVVGHPSGEPGLMLPALHQAARRMCDARMASLLLDAGADPKQRHSGLTAQDIAAIYGNKEFATVLEERGHSETLTGAFRSAAVAAKGLPGNSTRLNSEEIVGELTYLLHNLQRYPDRLEHSKRLISLGFGNDTPDEMGLTPVQLAGWEGFPDAVEYWLSLQPNLEHVNGFGGDLLSTIVHGSENCPNRGSRDHVACARLALRAGVPLPKLAPRFAGEESMAGFLAEWATGHPEQVVEHGAH